MMTIVYWLIVGWILSLTVWCLYKEEKTTAQITCALVAIPLILRLAGMK